MTEMRTVSAERYEMLRQAYRALEDRHDALIAASGISLDNIEARRLELAKWAAAEAMRWLDPRAGSGPTNEFGLKLREIAGLLTRAEGASPENP